MFLGWVYWFEISSFVVLMFISLSALASGLHWCSYEFHSRSYSFDKTLLEAQIK